MKELKDERYFIFLYIYIINKLLSLNKSSPVMTFQVVQSKVKQVEELGPAGPNPIPDEFEDSALSKTRYSTT